MSFKQVRAAILMVFITGHPNAKTSHALTWIGAHGLLLLLPRCSSCSNPHMASKLFTFMTKKPTGQGRVHQTVLPGHGHQSPYGRRRCASDLRPGRHQAACHPQRMGWGHLSCLPGQASRGSLGLHQHAVLIEDAHREHEFGPCRITSTYSAGHKMRLTACASSVIPTPNNDSYASLASQSYLGLSG